jgi:hypothetical protein
MKTMKAPQPPQNHPRRSVGIAIRDGIFGVLGSLTAMTVWVLAGSIFHQSLHLFTRLNATFVNIFSALGGFLIMTACIVVLAYILRIIEQKSRKAENAHPVKCELLEEKSEIV